MWKESPLKPAFLEVEIDGVRLSGREVKDLQRQWRDHLISTGDRLKPGDEDRVWTAVAARYPRYVKKVKKPGKPGVSIPAAWSFIQYLRARMKNKSLVDPLEAQRRAAICMSCPKKAQVLGCSKCKAILKLFIRPSMDLSKRCPPACGACSCYLPLKVWVPMEVLADSKESFEWAEGCWMLQE